MAALARARRFDWSNLGVRVASAAVLVPAAVAAAWFGGWAFLLLLSVGVALLSLEWAAMAAPGAQLRVATGMTAVILAAVFIAYQGWFPAAWGMVAIGAIGGALVARGTAERPADAAFGVCYIAAPILCLMWLRHMPFGAQWTLILFLVAWSADIAAYAVGSAFKGPKLWPRFSPNKTWSGFIGGLAGAALAGLGVAHFSEIPLVLVAGAGIGLLGGFATMAGDLLESMLKRRFGVKDSGDLIPGHGGLLDRVDGLMLAAVVFAGMRWVDHLGWAH